MSDPTVEAASQQSTRSSQSIKSAGIVSLAVMGSRVLGLIREQVFAKYFGAGMEYDAFLTAFRIPNLLRDLFAEGALSSAFVTTFSQYLARDGDEAAWRLANLVTNALLIILSLITLVGIWFSPELVNTIASGFVQIPGKSELTVTMTRIMFPFLLMVALASVAMGILNSKHRFGIPASASTMFNVGSIVGGLICAYLMPRYFNQPAKEVAIIGMAIGTLIGGALQFLIQVPSLFSVGYHYQPILSWQDPGVRQVLKLMAPAIIGTAAVQVNVLINSNFASLIPGNGPVAWLGYAFRLMQFPIGVFGVAIATVTAPAIARMKARKDMVEFSSTLTDALGMVFLLTIPSAIGLAVIGREIVALLYQYGEFTASDTNQTGAALAGYAVGLAGYAAIKVLTPAYYALDNVRVPMYVSLSSILLNYVLNWTMINQLGWGHRGLALATSIVALVNFVVLFVVLRNKLGELGEQRLLISFIKISLASAIMGLLAWSTSQVVMSPLKSLLASSGSSALIGRAIQTGTALAVAGLVFYLACRLLKVAEFDRVMAVLGRRLGKR
ncbi:MAG: murein biosynthesis integral membrane protein MurJ [Acidobacteriota bacterium]